MSVIASPRFQAETEEDMIKKALKLSLEPSEQVNKEQQDLLLATELSLKNDIWANENLSDLLPNTDNDNSIHSSIASDDNSNGNRCLLNGSSPIKVGSSIGKSKMPKESSLDKTKSPISGGHAKLSKHRRHSVDNALNGNNFRANEKRHSISMPISQNQGYQAKTQFKESTPLQSRNQKRVVTEKETQRADSFESALQNTSKYVHLPKFNGPAKKVEEMTEAEQLEYVLQISRQKESIKCDIASHYGSDVINENERESKVFGDTITTISNSSSGLKKSSAMIKSKFGDLPGRNESGRSRQIIYGNNKTCLKNKDSADINTNKKCNKNMVNTSLPNKDKINSKLIPSPTTSFLSVPESVSLRYVQEQQQIEVACERSMSNVGSNKKTYKDAIRDPADQILNSDPKIDIELRNVLEISKLEAMSEDEQIQYALNESKSMITRDHVDESQIINSFESALQNTSKYVHLPKSDSPSKSDIATINSRSILELNKQSDHLSDKELKTVRKGVNRKRPIVIDGCNVAMYHGKHQKFSAKGLQLMFEEFIKMGWTENQIQIFAKPCGIAGEDREICDRLEMIGSFNWTPVRRYGSEKIVCDDDNMILDYAKRKGGIVVSRDQYRDAYDRDPGYREVIEKRLLQFNFINDEIIFPRDPLGKEGPTLEKFLEF